VNHGDRNENLGDAADPSGGYGNQNFERRTNDFVRKRARQVEAGLWDDGKFPNTEQINAKKGSSSNCIPHKESKAQEELMRGGETQLKEGNFSPHLWREESCRRAEGESELCPSKMASELMRKEENDGGERSAEGINKRNIFPPNGEVNAFNAQIQHVGDTYAELGRKEGIGGEVYGINKLVKSPGGSSYPGPLLTEVVRNIKAAQNAQAETALTTWKRKFGESPETHATEVSPKQTTKKKRGVIVEGKHVEKGSKVYDKLTCENGSGMAEATEQPHRPQ
jgi:hypothetical protein